MMGKRFVGLSLVFFEIYDLRRLCCAFFIDAVQVQDNRQSSRDRIFLASLLSYNRVFFALVESVAGLLILTPVLHNEQEYLRFDHNI